MCNNYLQINTLRRNLPNFLWCKLSILPRLENEAMIVSFALGLKMSASHRKLPASGKPEPPVGFALSAADQPADCYA